MFIHLGWELGEVSKRVVPIPSPKPPCPQILRALYQLLGTNVGSERPHSSVWTGAGEDEQYTGRVQVMLGGAWAPGQLGGGFG